MPSKVFGISVFLLAAAPLLSQVDQATILGIVTDNTGSVVAGASVTVRNTGTDERRVTKTDDRGNYIVQALNIGAYEVSVEHPGFSKQTVSGIALIVNQQARIDVKLQVGAVTQELTVQADAPLVQTDDATVSQLINSQQITELPIPANRNMFRLALMGGGMSRGPASSVTTSGFGPGFGIAAYGQKVHNNWIMLDGAPLRTAMHGEVRMRPSVEALEEFRVEAGFYYADFGTESGAQIISAIRPGSNRFHGTALRVPAQRRAGRAEFLRESGPPEKAAAAEQFRRSGERPHHPRQVVLHHQLRGLHRAVFEPGVRRLSRPTP